MEDLNDIKTQSCEICMVKTVKDLALADVREMRV